MPPQRPLFPTADPHLQVMLTDDGSRTLLDNRLNETYHSGCGALSECLSVYLRNSGIEARLQSEHGQQTDDLSSNRDCAIRVLEFGFGTGLSALLTMSAAKVWGRPMEFTSLERNLLSHDILREVKIADAVNAAIARGQLAPTFKVAQDLEQRWLDFRAGLPTVLDASAAYDEFQWDAGDDVHLKLMLGDATEFDSQIWKPKEGHSNHRPPQWDAIYFDAFSPATNPQLWTEAIFAKLEGSLRPLGRLVSYCVSGEVRRRMQAAGFAVTRVPGPPGGKREVLVAVPNTSIAFDSRQP